MSVSVFVDTNVLVYARDASERVKQPLAQAWMEQLWSGGNGRLSMQVLQEYHVTVTQKLKPGLGVADARADVRSLAAWKPVATDAELVERAWKLQDDAKLSFWDALIVAAAARAQCRYLLSEDLQDGRTLDGVQVTNPFKTRPATLLQ